MSRTLPTWWKILTSRSSRSGSNPDKARRVPSLEVLEDRTVPATLFLDGWPEWTSDGGDEFASWTGVPPPQEGTTVGHTFGAASWDYRWWGYASHQHNGWIAVDEGDVQITIRPSPGESIGDEVQITISAWTDAYWGHYLNAQFPPVEDEHSVEASASGPNGQFLDFFARPARGATESASGSQTYIARIGDTIPLTFRLYVNREGGWPPDNLVGHLSVFTTVTDLVETDLVATDLEWTPAEGGLDLTYDVNGDSLPPGQTAVAAVYWANDDSPVGGPIFTAYLDGTAGADKKLHIPAEWLTNLPFSTDPDRIEGGGNLLDATQLLVVIDPDNLIGETNEQGTAESNNKWSRELFQVRAKPDFKLTFTHPVTDETTTLDPTLLDNFMRLASDLVAQNAVTDDITLNEGVRDPVVAHQWSTSWMIRVGRFKYKCSSTLFDRLRALQKGTDLDGNVWYMKEWETKIRAALRQVGIAYQTATGQLTPTARKLLWMKIEKNSEQYDKRTDKTAEAADGYAKGDQRRRPNTHPGEVSPHVFGRAIDASIRWRFGVMLSTGLVTTGEVGYTKKDGTVVPPDPAANDYVAWHGLLRPVKKEMWHFELV